jgi:hypothetical protein
MDWGWIIIAASAILGVGLIAGGFVLYRGSERVGFRALGAAAVAVGVVMWVGVLLVTPTSRSGEGPSAPTDVFERVAG